MGGADTGLDAGAQAPAFEQEVDASGLTCPLPILRAKKALAQMASGEVLRVITTDRNAIRDSVSYTHLTLPTTPYV